MPPALKARGVVHMDTPMLGSQPQAVSGEIFFIVGGERRQLAAIKPYLEIMGALHMYVGRRPAANRVKLIAQRPGRGDLGGGGRGARGVRAVGGRSEHFYEVVRNGGGMAFGTYFDRRGKRMLDGEFSPTFLLELMLKDAGLALDLARSAKVPTPMLEETKRTYGEAVASGWGKEDFSAVTHVIEKRIGRRLSNNPPT